MDFVFVATGVCLAPSATHALSAGARVLFGGGLLIDIPRYLGYDPQRVVG